MGRMSRLNSRVGFFVCAGASAQKRAALSRSSVRWSRLPDAIIKVSAERRDTRQEGDEFRLPGAEGNRKRLTANSQACVSGNLHQLDNPEQSGNSRNFGKRAIVTTRPMG